MYSKSIVARLIHRKAIKKTFRFLWAFSILMARLSVIFSVRVICLFIGAEASNKRTANSTTETNSAKKYVVYLSKNDANFNTKKDTLKSAGYLWHSGLRAWALPTVKLERNQAEFGALVSDLKKLGYVWNRVSGLWELTFPKYQVIRIYQHQVITEA